MKTLNGKLTSFLQDEIANIWRGFVLSYHKFKKKLKELCHEIQPN